LQALLFDHLLYAGYTGQGDCLPSRRSQIPKKNTHNKPVKSVPLKVLITPYNSQITLLRFNNTNVEEPKLVTYYLSLLLSLRAAFMTSLSQGFIKSNATSNRSI